MDTLLTPPATEPKTGSTQSMGTRRGAEGPPLLPGTYQTQAGSQLDNRQGSSLAGGGKKKGCFEVPRLKDDSQIRCFLRERT